MKQTQRRYRWILSNMTRSAVTFTSLYLLVLNLFFPELLQYFLGTQWEGTRTIVLCFSIYVLIYSGCTVVVQSIFASNQAKFLFQISLASMICAWTIGLAFVNVDGARGYGLYYLLMNLYSAVIYWKGAKLLQFDFKESHLKPLAATALTALLFVAYRMSSLTLPPNKFAFLGEVSTTIILFLALNYLLWARMLVASIPRDLRRKKAAQSRAQQAQLEAKVENDVLKAG